MNYFPIADNHCPIQSAKQQCGKHVVRQPIETAGMIMFAFPEGETPYPNPRKHHHYKHPASFWTRESKENLEWAILHGLAQCEEYSRRYKRRHAAQDHVEWAEKNYKHLTFPIVKNTPLMRCFGPFKQELEDTEKDTLIAYRKFYWLDKQSFARWPSKKEIPEWWPEISDKYVDKSFINGVYSKR